MYQRKRLAQNFVTPPAKRQTTTKSHSPDFTTTTWDKDAVLHDLQQLALAPPPINWQKFAREHNVPGDNCGQVVKEFAKKSGIDVQRLDGRTPGTRTPKRKRRLYGGEISVPVPPTTAQVRESWTDLVRTGQLSLGVPCSPFTLVSYNVHNGHLEQQNKIITGRKFPLKEIRQQLTTRHEKYMRLATDNDINNISKEELLSKLSAISEECKATSTVEQLREQYKTVQRSRTLAIWHDHATLLGLGTLMIMVHVVYGPAVFYTQQEVQGSINLQATIEQQEIHLIAAGSSSTQDQVALL